MNGVHKLIQALWKSDFGSKAIWRSPKSVVTPERMEKHLKLGHCDKDLREHLKYLLNVATWCVERDCHTAAGLQIREMTFECFPSCEPILLDIAPVWTLAEWTAFVDGGTDPDLVATIEGQFSSAGDVPAEIIADASDCNCSPVSLLGGEDFVVHNHRRPARLCPVQPSYMWPPTCACGIHCDNITVRYLAGSVLSGNLEEVNPPLAHQILMLASLSYQSPETGGLGRATDIMELMNMMGRKLKWRP